MMSYVIFIFMMFHYFVLTYVSSSEILFVTSPLWRSVRMTFTLLKCGLGSPPWLPNTQSSIAGVQTPRLEVFFILLERSQSVNVKNGLASAIQTSVTQVMVKRRAGSQTGNLTLDYKKLRIDPTLVRASGMWHTVGKLLRRATIRSLS
jgi:hypothetical protein